jgi:hypothetical protein
MHKRKIPSVLISGRNENSILPAANLLTKKRYMEAIRTAEQSGSVSPLKRQREYTGVNKINAKTIRWFFTWSKRQIFTVKKTAMPPQIMLNIFIPINPNWENGALSNVNNGLPHKCKSKFG